MKPKKIVMIGFLGTQLDSGTAATRWERWRPTVAMAQQEDVILDRIELLYSGKYGLLLDQVEQDVAAVSPQTRVNRHALVMRDLWDFGDVYGSLFDFAQTYPFDPEHEEYWIHITTGTHVVQICLFLMTETRYFPGILLQTSPPRRKTPDMRGTYALIDLDLKRYDRIAQRFANQQQAAVAFLKSGIATKNVRFNAMIDEIERVALKSKAPMLLMGPTGAGKSFLARRVFEMKKARHQLSGKFVELNCATLHGDGAASTLFGHIKGSFTGAVAERAGLLRSAHQGLLFLDEIGELGLDEQAMLLKAIEEKRFLPVGGDAEVQSDFQLMAGTNRDLGLEVAAGRFREDLYARINLWTYELPGLAGRREDIEPNLDYLLAQFGHEQGQMVRFNKEARQRYLRFALAPEALWSGNFRDLSASVTRMATLAETGRIDEALVDSEVARLTRLWGNARPGHGGALGLLARSGGPSAGAADDVLDLSDLLGAEAARLDWFDEVQLRAVLAVCLRAKSLSEAGRALFAVSRTAKEKPNDADRLKKYLARFGLSWERLQGAAAAG